MFARRILDTLTLAVLIAAWPCAIALGQQNSLIVTDYERPYAYVIDRGSSLPGSAQMRFLNTGTGIVEKTIAVGANAVDATINYGDGRLYVANWQQNETTVVDLQTQEVVSPLLLGTDVYKINAGRSGRIYFEEQDQWISVPIVDTGTGAIVGQLPSSVREGDGEIESTGTYYYHCDNNISNAHITKYDISTDLPFAVATSNEHAFGSRNLVLSRDGSRLFWRGYVYDADLNEIGNLNDEIVATSRHGDLAISASQVYNSHNGQLLHSFATPTPTAGLSADQAQFVRVLPGGSVELTPVGQIVAAPGAASGPAPSDTETIVLPLAGLDWTTDAQAFRYQVYFGTDPSAVAAATPASPEYLGEFIDSRAPLPGLLALGQRYFWRVDAIGLNDTTAGPLWSFDVAPLVVGPAPALAYAVPGGPPQTIELTLTADGSPVAWSVSEQIPWLTASTTGGSTPDTLTLTVDPAGLTVGYYGGALSFTSGQFAFDVQFELEVFAMSVSKMLTDYGRPYIYALHPGSITSDDARLLFINTDSEQVEKAISIGTNPTDLTINYGENRLYVSNWQHEETRIVDLSSQEQLDPLFIGSDVFVLNAGRAGRIYFEQEDQWVDAPIVDTATGDIVGMLPWPIREGDAEVDPTGNWLYHCDNNSSGAVVTKYDISTDDPVAVAESLGAGYGSRNLLLSADGSRVFWRGFVHDADLNRIGSLTEEVYATTLGGELAISETRVINSQNGEMLHAFAVASPSVAVSGDQAKVFRFNPVTSSIDVTLLADIADVAGPGLNPLPAEEGTVVMPVESLSWDFDPSALGYQVYLGTDPLALAAADTSSPEFLGEVQAASFALEPGTLQLGVTYYWRVDVISFVGTVSGPVWSFSVFPLNVAPATLSRAAVLDGQRQIVEVTLTADSATTWSASDNATWLELDRIGGATPATLRIALDPAGLPAGTHSAEVTLTAGGLVLNIPVSFDVFEMALTRMLADQERPYIYGLHAGSGSFEDAYLVFIHSETAQVEKAIPIGINPTDMTINYGEGRLYVSNWQNNLTRVVDLSTQEQVAPLALGPDVFRINAGRPGRVYTEEEDQWINVSIVDTAAGAIVGQLPFSIREGDGEIDSTGSFYYHSENNISSANIIKYDISTDNPAWVGESIPEGGGSRNLILSPDGSRLFRNGYVYDADLNSIGYLADEIYSTTLHGDLAISQTQVFNVATGASIFALPYATTVSAVSGDQASLVLFDPVMRRVDAIAMTDIADIPGPGLNPSPADSGTIVLPLDELRWDISPLAIAYRVFLGTDPAAVAAADENSPEFIGEVAGNSIGVSGLSLDRVYYWRVDVVGFTGVAAGPVWSFTVAPLVVAPNRLALSTVVGAPPRTVSLQLSATARGGVPWNVSEDIPWLSVDASSGTAPGTLAVTVDPAGLAAGSYSGVLEFTSGKIVFEVPVEFELFDMALTRMLTDFERPYVYGLHAGSGDFADAFLIFFNTDTEQIEKAMPIGINPTDMTINYGDGRLYVTNWQHDATRVVDLETQEELAPLTLGTDVFRVNAGRPGRIYVEEEDQWVAVSIVDSNAGTIVGGVSFSVREGDGEIDPTGSYYYHCDNNISNAHITKYDISTDNPVALAESLEHAYGSRNLVLSGDGSRLFWRGYVYDDDLNEIGNLADEIYSTTLRGDLAISESQVYNTHTGEPIYALPAPTAVSAVSGDQTKLVLFDPGTGQLATIAMADIADIPGAGLNPAPSDTATIVLPLDQLSWDRTPAALAFDVYFGTDAAAVAAADPASPEYLGETTGDSMPLPDVALGTTYFWRVDVVGFAATIPGAVWSFDVFPIVIAPRELSVAMVAGGPPSAVSLTLNAGGAGVAWSASEDIDWLTLNASSGTTPDTVTATLDPAGLAAGLQQGTVTFTAGDFAFGLPVRFEIFEMNLTRMLTDHERPYVYGLHAGSGEFEDAFLLFIHTGTKQVERVIPIGINPTDMTINYGEGRLYVSNWLNSFTRVVDLTTQEQVAPLELGPDVFKINAGRPGRVYFEEQDQWIDAPIVATNTGTIVGALPYPLREGDAEIDPTGSYYYHSDNNISNAHITKYDITTDNPVVLAESLEHAYGSRNLVLSGDGSRLFWRGYVYDDDLNEIGNLADEIYTTTLHGDLAVSESRVYNAVSGENIYTLPYTTTVSAVSGDQGSLFLFDPVMRRIDAIAMTDIADIPGPGLNPSPGDSGTVVLPLDELSWDISPLASAYRVYFGTDAAAVAAADETSPEFIGEVTDNRIGVGPLSLSQVYFWRVDVVGFSGTAPGPVWSFGVAPLVIAPNELALSTVVGAGSQTVTLSLAAIARGGVPWNVSEDIPWLSVDASSGTAPGTLAVTLDPSGLVAGNYSGVLEFTSGKTAFGVPVEFTLFDMALTRMLTDFERPYVYGLHAGSGNFPDAFVVVFNTDSEQIEKAIPIGINPTDMTINYGEGRLYVSNWLSNFTRVVDLTTNEQVAPLELGTDVYKINAGRPGRIYFEGQNQWVDGPIVDTNTGMIVGQLPFPLRAGDAEIDPTGSFYYHCDDNISNAHITKYDISTDTPIAFAESLEHPYGSRNLVLSGDGSRLFWRGFVYDDDLNEIGNLADEIYTTSLRGDLAISETQVYNAHTGNPIYALPVATLVSAVSGDDAKLVLFDPGSGEFVVIPMTDIADLPGPGLNPVPGDTQTVILPVNTLGWSASPLAFGYRVYLGTDPTAVAAADESSAEFLGMTLDTEFDPGTLALGETYYWRVDQEGFAGLVTGTVWSFTVAPLVVEPNRVELSAVTVAPAASHALATTADGGAVAWSVTEQIDWLTLGSATGVTPEDLIITVDPAGLLPGIHSGILSFASGDFEFDVPIEFEVFEMALSKLLSDRERPYIYGLHPGSGDFDDAFIVFINTDTQAVENAMPIGINPTDMTINYGDDKLYVSNWLQNATQVVDLTTQTRLPPLSLGTDVFKINAGRAGRIYFEGYDQWVDGPIVDTASGTIVGQLPFPIREGDAEIDPTGTWLYHCDNNISNAHITKYSIATDNPVEVAISFEHPYGSRNLVMSGDGSRLFWRGFAYDANLIELGHLGVEIYSASMDGGYAVSDSAVYDTASGAHIYTLPFFTQVSAEAGDESALYLYDPSTGAIQVIPRTDIVTPVRDKYDVSTIRALTPTDNQRQSMH